MWTWENLVPATRKSSIKHKSDLSFRKLGSTMRQLWGKRQGSHTKQIAQCTVTKMGGTLHTTLWANGLRTYLSRDLVGGAAYERTLHTTLWANSCLFVFTYHLFQLYIRHLFLQLTQCSLKHEKVNHAWFRICFSMYQVENKRASVFFLCVCFSSNHRQRWDKYVLHSPFDWKPLFRPNIVQDLFCGK